MKEIDVKMSRDEKPLMLMDTEKSNHDQGRKLLGALMKGDFFLGSAVQHIILSVLALAKGYRRFVCVPMCVQYVRSLCAPCAQKSARRAFLLPKHNKAPLINDRDSGIRYMLDRRLGVIFRLQ